MKWERQIEILSEQGQQSLANARIAIVGTGGIGSHFAQLGAYVGFRRFLLIDFDVNAEENRNRSAREADMGRFKVECLAEQLKEIDSQIDVEICNHRIEEAPELLQDCTAIASCADNWQARMFANERAVEGSKLLVDMGFGFANGKMGCHAAFYRPGGACMLCGILQEGAAPPSNVTFLPTMMIAASLGIELLVAELTDYDKAGKSRPNLLFYDAIQRTLTSLRRIPRENCRCKTHAS